jgi:hypothetical protein
MSKTTIFELKATLKAGKALYLKGTKFTEENLPAELKAELNSGTGTIEVFSFGEDFEGSSFNPDQSITVTEPKKKLIGRPKGTSKLLKKKS